MTTKNLSKVMKNNLEHPPPKFTSKELLEMFPDAREMIPKKIKECQTEIKKKECEITNALETIYAIKTDEFSKWFGEEIVKVFMMPGLAKLENILFQLNKLKYLINPTQQKNDRFEFEEKIEIARQYPIAELARNKLELKQVGKNYQALCPFHNEKHASFYIYPETNSYHCYGCGSHGDQISLLMALEGVQFVDAVKMLQN